MSSLGPSNTICRVYTFKEGLLSAVAHDLELEVRGFSIDVAGDGKVQASFDATSLRVIGAVRDGKTVNLFASDHGIIERATQNDVLAAPRYPKIEVDGQVSKDLSHFTGTLRLHGVTRPLEIDLKRDGGRISADVSLQPSLFGIKPYRAMFGALKLEDRVRVHVDAPVDLPAA